MAENKGSIAAQAWNATKADTDPAFGSTNEPEFWGKLDFAAERVIATGTATTNFELKVKELHDKEKDSHKGVGEPMAVVEEPAAITAGTAANKPADAPAKASSKKIEKTGTQKTDKSGETLKPAAKLAAAKEEAKAPRHP